jgi:hypothetical protein
MCGKTQVSVVVFSVNQKELPDYINPFSFPSPQKPVFLFVGGGPWSSLVQVQFTYRIKSENIYNMLYSIILSTMARYTISNLAKKKGILIIHFIYFFSYRTRLSMPSVQRCGDMR